MRGDRICALRDGCMDPSAGSGARLRMTNLGGRLGNDIWVEPSGSNGGRSYRRNNLDLCTHDAALGKCRDRRNVPIFTA